MAYYTLKTLNTPKNHYKKFNKVEKYKINVQKSSTFLYTNNKLSEKEINEIVSFIITSKRIKYLEINLPKQGKDLYSEKYKILMKATEDTNRWKDLHISQLEESIVLK